MPLPALPPVPVHLRVNLPRGALLENKMPTSLTFQALREANLKRLPLFKNAKGGPAHSEPDGSDWCLAQWSNATLGELGEAANIIKKVDRGDMTLDEARPLLAKELADTQTYLDLLAYRAGIDLSDATIAKWNEVSERIGVPLRLTPHGVLDWSEHIARFAVKTMCSPRFQCSVMIVGLASATLKIDGVEVTFEENPSYRAMALKSLVLAIEGNTLTVVKNRHGVSGQVYTLTTTETETCSIPTMYAQRA